MSRVLVAASLGVRELGFSNRFFPLTGLERAPSCVISVIDSSAFKTALLPQEDLLFLPRERTLECRTQDSSPLTHLLVCGIY